MVGVTHGREAGPMKRPDSPQMEMHLPRRRSPDKVKVTLDLPMPLADKLEAEAREAGTPLESLIRERLTDATSA